MYQKTRITDVTGRPTKAEDSECTDPKQSRYNITPSNYSRLHVTVVLYHHLLILLIYQF